ncbi:hypothetical protein QVD17_26932 [Tagetes erecta]|uniref:TIR domain-containing protein n=1 Tax=Tagetes erecta TaxID=13708 RepID=A0AAD8NR74_TARER|nr:hypothetical protein QVD17_26932 [Tagetes erecta]
MASSTSSFGIVSVLMIFSIIFVMASSSTLSGHRSFAYDVFISFRGKDTRKNFVDHLYFALQHKHIHTFKDDNIKRGEKIGDELIKSIEDSKFYIVVFSKNYASSSWCLDEILKIMECHRMTHGHKVYPLFYDVEPYEVRKLTGAVEEAFSEHRNEVSSEKWREALKEVAHLAGWELKNTCNGYEAKFIQKVVEQISLDLYNSNLDENLICRETMANIGLQGVDYTMTRTLCEPSPQDNQYWQQMWLQQLEINKQLQAQINQLIANQLDNSSSQYNQQEDEENDEIND